MSRGDRAVVEHRAPARLRVREVDARALNGVEEATLKLADGSTAGLTLHTVDGTIPQLRRALDRSLDAFFDFLPGADEEDLKRFGE